MATMKQRPHYHGHRERLRERLGKAPRSLADYEIIELALAHALPRRDTKPLAKELLARRGSLRAVFQATGAQLTEVPGLGPGVEAFWTLLTEIRARVSEAPVAEKAVFSSPEAVAELAMARFGHLRTEEFWVALVDNKNRLLGWEKVSEGTVDQTAVYVREVLMLALRHQASGMILVHNHPGGDPRPSTQDLELTRRLARAGADLGIRVLDHLVVTEKEYYSFQHAQLI